MKTLPVAAAVLCALLSTNALAGEFVLVVNKKNPVSAVRESDLKRLFTGKKKAIGEMKAVPINQELDSEVATAFLHDIVGMTPQEYKEYWIAQQVKGLASAPMIQRSDESVVAMVSQLPGAIGYVTADADVSAVKQLAIK